MIVKYGKGIFMICVNFWKEAPQEVGHPISVFKKFRKYSKRFRKLIHKELDDSNPVYSMFKLTESHVDRIIS